MKVQITIPELTVEVEIENVRMYKGTTSAGGPDPSELDYETGDVFIGDMPVPTLIAQDLLDLIDKVDLDEKVAEVADQELEAARDAYAERKGEERD